MLTLKFSLSRAYSIGLTTIINRFMFFMGTSLVAMCSSMLFMILLGLATPEALLYYISSMLGMVHHAMYSLSGFTGILQHQNFTMTAMLSSYIPAEVVQEFIYKHALWIDISKYNVEYVLYILAPASLVVKLIFDIIMLCWIRIGLYGTIHQQTILPTSWYAQLYVIPRVFVVNCIVGCVTMLGLAFFIVPGIIMYQRLRFARYFIIDKNLSIFKALQSSFALTQNAVLQLIGFSFVASIITALSSIFFIVGLFMLPLGSQVEVNVYQQLLGEK